MSLGVYPGIGGLDRLRISTELQRLNLTFTILNDAAEAEQAVKDGTIGALLTDSLTASTLASPALPAHLLTEFERYPLAIALWRGDISLLKEVNRHLADMHSDGTLAKIYMSNPN